MRLCGTLRGEQLILLLSYMQFIEDWRDPSSGIRLVVEAWQILALVEGQYIERPRSPHMVWHYLKRLGPIQVIRKIRSRLAEAQRNRKVAAIGVARVLAAPENIGLVAGQRVIFFAPNHPEKPETICLDVQLVRPVSWLDGSVIQTGKATLDPEKLRPFFGWSPYEAVPIDCDALDTVLAEFAPIYRKLIDAIKDRKTVINTLEPMERIESSAVSGECPTAVVFGLGNYAKTQIIPEIRRSLISAGTEHIYVGNRFV